MNLRKDGILSELKNPKRFNITVLEKIDSTNSYLKELAKQGESEGRVIIANSQTGGRGRYDRRFYSPENTGIYMSILLKPTLLAEKSVLITAAAAVAVCDAVEKICGKSASIKWVNDIFINGKKVCGILTEGSLNTETGGFNWAVLGLGINVYTPKNGFSPEIENIAGAVTERLEENLRNRLCAKILENFFNYYEKLEQKSFLESYRKKSCVIGKKIDVIKNEHVLGATALDIDDECRLAVKYENGKTEYLSSGEISIKIK